MESDLLAVSNYAVEQPGVTGYICVDNKGLCLATKGQVNQNMSGIIHQLTDLASKIEEPTKESPVIKVELDSYKILIHSHDSVTTALISPQK